MKRIYFSRIMPGMESGWGAVPYLPGSRSFPDPLPLEWVSSPKGDRIDAVNLEKKKVAGEMSREKKN